MVKWSRSLRVRLQLWHALILTCVVLSFGSLLYHQVVTSRWDEIDAGLLRTGRILEGAMREVPRPVLDSLAQDLGAPRGAHPPPPPRAGQTPGGPPTGGASGGRPGPASRAAALEWEQTIPSSLDHAWEQGIELPKYLPASLADPAGPAYYVIWRADGSILRQQDLPYAATARPQYDPTVRPSRLIHERGMGPLREVLLRGPNDTLICVGRPVGAELYHMWKLAGQLFLAGATILGAGLCGGWWLSRSAVDPIARMTHTAEGIHASNLSQRIDLHNIDRELEQLGEVLNAMLSRLEQSFETQKRFAADASHELRTPLATMLSTIELSLSKERQPAEYQQHLLKCQRAAMRMHELVASLLQLTRSDANVTSHAFESVHLADVVGDVVDSLQDRAAARGIAIHCQLAPVQVQGRAGELTQVVTNLVQNAITYNRDGGSIEIRLAIEGSAALLQVRDTGVGIAAEHLPHVFERFYRVDKARTHSSGYGLGLAICQSIVQQHRGTISVTSQPQQGSEFSVRIPIGSTVLA